MKKHIAGIVPVSGIQSDFDMPWHESLMPISPNYLAVERSVAECAYAGCDSIWIVCSREITPLIRYQVGEKIQDPVYDYRHFEFDKNSVKKPIRIYYVPVAIKDINKRDNLCWSAIYGAQVCKKVMSSLSKHLTPGMFYISWPYGYYNPKIIRNFRKDLFKGPVSLTFDNKSAKDNLYLALTLDNDQIDMLIKESVSTSSGLWSKTERKRLPANERYSYKNFDLQQVLKSISFEKYKKIDIETYYSIDNWSNYCKLLSANIKISKPKILKFSEWNEIGLDDEDIYKSSEK